MRLLGLTLLIWLSVRSASAQEPLALRLDTSIINTMTPHECIPTADGGYVLDLAGTDGRSLWKCSADGTPLWRNKYDQGNGSNDSYIDIAPCANGDILYAVAAGCELIGISTTGSWTIRRIDPSGNVLWHFRYTSSFAPSLNFVAEQRVQIAENSTGEIFLLETERPSSEMNWRALVTKLTPSGQTIWAARVGENTSTMNWPCSASCTEGSGLSPDVDGGCRITAPIGGPNEERFVIARIDPGGSLVWAREVNYLGASSANTTIPGVVTDEGNTLVASLNYSFNTGLHIVRISPQGELIRVDRYPLASNWGASLGYDQGELLLRFYDKVFVLDTNGQVLHGSEATLMSPNSNYFYQIATHFFNVFNGRAVLSGSFGTFPTGAGLPEFSPAITGFDPHNEEDACLRTPVTLDHDLLPNDLFSCTPAINYISESVDLAVSDSDEVFLLEPLLQASGLCTLNSVRPVQEVPSGVHLSNSIATTGDVVLFSAQQQMRCTVYNALGAPVWSSSERASEIAIPIDHLAVGQYVVVGKDLSDKMVGRLKLMVH